MVMRRHLACVQRVSGFSPHFSQDKAVTNVGGDASLEIGQCEVYASITTVSGAQQREQGLVLVDGQQLAIAESPALGSKVEAHDLYFR